MLSKTISTLLDQRKVALHLSIILVAAGAVLFTVRVSELVSQWESFDKSQAMAQTVTTCLSDLKDMETGQRGYMLTGKVIYLTPFENGSRSLKNCLATMQNYSKDADEGYRETARKIVKLAGKKEAELRSTVLMRQQGYIKEALDIVNSGFGKGYMDEVRRIVAESESDKQEKIIAMRRALSEELHTIQYVFLGWLLSLATLMSIVLGSMRRSQMLLRAAKETLAHEATHDALTGLPNRRYLLDWLSTSIPRVLRMNDTVGIIYIDLDGFSGINNTYGHAAGDATLIWATETLRQTLRASDFVARLGGDEFVIVCASQSQEQLEQLANRLLSLFAQSTPRTDLPNGTVSLSMGIAMVPKHACTADELLRLGDQAMYRAKQAGKRCYRIAEEITFIAGA